MYKHIKELTFCLLTICLLCTSSTVGQTLLKPDLKFGTSACDDTNVKKDFIVEINFSGTAFASDNKFILELSDASGSFASPTEVKEVQDASLNAAFKFDLGFQLPNGTYGTGYKIRVKSSNPESTSPESDVFAAYDMIGDGPILTLVDANEVLCGSDTFTIEIANLDGETGVFQWFKDGALTPFTTTNEPRLTVSEAGRYQARIDYGACGNRQTIIAIVTGLTPADAQILGPSEVEICGDQTHTFEATTQDTVLYDYQWFKDGSAISGATAPTYTTPNAGQFGNYKVQIIAKDGSCSVESAAEVELKQQTTAGFTITTVDAGKNVILPCETIGLKIEGVPASATIQWYKDNVPLPSRTQPEMNARDPGEYFARVTEVGSSTCNAIVDSEVYELFGLKEFSTEIRAEDYEECNTNSTILKVVGIKAIGTDDNEYELSQDRLTSLTYQWYKDGAMVPSATTVEYRVDSYVDNGAYVLEVASCPAGNIKTNSINTLDIKLIAPDPLINSSQTSNSLCPGGNISYTIDELDAGYTYEWYKDDETTPFAVNEQTITVTEVGVYTLKFFDANCSKDMGPIEVVPFDDSVIEVTPSDKVVLQQGQTVTVTASGAESYVWYEGADTTGAVLSTNETLDVSALGFYTIVATVGTCSVVKTIEAVEQDDQEIVPNIVSPNGDGINDTWQITNRLAFQPTVSIVIYNANGKEVFKTTDYQNNWPVENLGIQKVFYYKIIREDVLIKAGTISVLD
ncbi:Putative adhesin precursor SprC [Tenacibaculum sp. 190130A14a]|uniref:Ig-like domain-containing protein n=1 Tax=Tenacibaculum polynesiense TaxID=3137857 RepID=A0ABP1EYN5_9FLAO